MSHLHTVRAALADCITDLGAKQFSDCKPVPYAVRIRAINETARLALAATEPPDYDQATATRCAQTVEALLDDRDEIEAQLTDLIANIKHYCHANGLDYYILAANAHEHYTEEIHEPKEN